MPTSTLTSKGQITLPRAVREHLRLAAGDRIDFLIGEDGRVELRSLGRPVADLRGMLRREGSPVVELAELDDSLADYLAEEDDRVRSSG